MIEARGLTRGFDGRTAVSDLSFRVPEGSLCALLGPNGAGKTTTIRLLLGLLPPDSGSAVVSGVELPSTDAEGARPGPAPGSDRASRVLRRMSAPRTSPVRRLSAWVRPPCRGVQHWLKRLELWEARDRPFATWSKGMKQRLALIRAVLHEPSVVFLDEPTAGLDPAGAREVRDLIADLKREGRTILLSTHNLAEAEALADLTASSGAVVVFRSRAQSSRGLRLETGRRSRPSQAGGAAKGARSTDDGGGRHGFSTVGPPRGNPAVVREMVAQGRHARRAAPGPALENISHEVRDPP